MAHTISISRHLQCPAAKVFKVVEDIERYYTFMPNVSAITVLEHEGNRKVTRWETMLDDAPFDWVEEGIYDYDNLIVRFRVLEGLFERFDGYWQVTPEIEGCRLTFELTYETGLPEIEEIVAPIVHERINNNVESMLAAIEKQAETIG